MNRDTKTNQQKYKTPEEKVDDLKKDIRKLGFLVEDLEDGEIKIELRKH
ncbi:MAG: hypothetical protein NTZ97_04085 [Candidatus Moranbacteria bacterium]|nr:hypothetical protein [Candidatus Moranbacteria bacterium]